MWPKNQTVFLNFNQAEPNDIAGESQTRLPDIPPDHPSKAASFFVLFTGCMCNTNGSMRNACNSDGVCPCKVGFGGKKCKGCTVSLASRHVAVHNLQEA